MGTRWGFSEARMFNYYNKQGPIFVLSFTSRKLPTKYAFHPATDLLVNEDDVRLKVHDIASQFGSLPGWKKLLDYLIKHHYQK